MQSDRIISIQRRAKRRILALAVVAGAFAGYGALTIFAQDERSVQVPIEKMSHAPGVKAVGIRLIGSSGKLPSPTNSSQAAPAGLLPPPSLPMPSLPAPTMVNTLAQLPAPTVTSQPSYTSLPAPPRMQDIQSSQSAGKVIMKLNGAAPTETAPESQPSTITSSVPAGPAVSESVDIRVVPVRSMGQPAKMPPFIFESAKRNGAAEKETTLPSDLSTPTQPQAAIRMSIADNSAKQSPSDSPTTFPTPATSSTTPKSRAPQLMKSKSAQLEHTVMLAQSTEIETRTLNDEPAAFVPPVEVDSSLVPHSIAEATKSNRPRSLAQQAVISDAVADAFVGLAPPARDLQHESSQISQRAKGGATEPPIDHSRRKFDARPAYQTPIATMDLESLAATSMDLAGRLVAIAVQDENICKVLHNERTVSLVGNQPGSTLVQIWTADLGDKPQVVRVNVNPPGGKAQASSAAVKDIKQVIAQSFPKANVSIISKEDGGIEVRGTTESEESALRILELVRKLYLVPVKDKLTVEN